MADFTGEEYENWLKAGGVFIIILCLQIWRGYFRNKAVNLDSLVDTPSDYTVVMKNLPHDFGGEDIDEHIEAFIKEKHPNLDVKHVVLAYDVFEFVWWVKERDLMRGARAKGWSYDHERYKELHKKIEEHEHEFDTGKSNKFRGVAYITFNKASEANEFLQTYNIDSSFKKLLIEVFGLKSRAQYESPTKETKWFYTEEAPEPEDVGWENYSLNHFQVAWRRIFGYIVILAIIGGNFYLTKELVGITDSLNSQADGTDSILNKEKLTLILFLIAQVNILVSSYIGEAITYTMEFAYYSTMTDKMYAQTIIQMLSVFFNYVLSIFFLAVYRKEYFGNTGLIVQMFMLFHSTFWSKPFYTYFSIGVVKKVLRIILVTSSIETCQKTQGELNELLSYMAFPISTKIGTNITYVYGAVFYAGIAPLIVFWCMMGLLTNLLMDRIILVERCSKIEFYASSIILEATEQLEWSLVFYAVVHILFSLTLKRWVSS